MPAKEDFVSELDRLLREAQEAGLPRVSVSAGELHRRVGGYPGSDHRMPVRCAAMKARKRALDLVVGGPPSGQGATLQIEYQLPR